ncbi:hypothetical protein I7I51_07641 [Histoplasma capsulatum]|uniref:Uncharacterized protein n=1 Tax=Ajellomyces capsulatus TaxID=5037 RepID=A0A8A1LVK7_AJECA|nr:hypothetical protein I7I51_07641 [Histoplasma capsulatum]
MDQEPLFDVVRCLPPDDDLISDARKEIQNTLDKTEAFSEFGYVPLGWGSKCDELFHHGLNLSGNTLIEQQCGPYSDAEKIRMVVLMSKNHRPLLNVSVGPNYILIFRPFKDILDSNNGFFKMRNGRCISSSQSFDCLQLDQALILDGNVRIDYPLTGGGLCMLLVMKKKI